MVSLDQRYPSYQSPTKASISKLQKSRQGFKIRGGALDEQERKRLQHGREATPELPPLTIIPDTTLNESRVARHEDRGQKMSFSRIDNELNVEEEEVNKAALEDLDLDEQRSRLLEQLGEMKRVVYDLGERLRVAEERRDAYAGDEKSIEEIW
jgi:hypothetical protein